ncbi:hypothetical protein AMELA_G00226960, partial [Ameiurus melas]
MKRHVSGQTAEPDGFTERLKGTSAAERPNSPAPSCVSMKSDASMGVEITFSQGDKSSGKSERDFLIETGQERSRSENLQRSAERPNSPAPSCVSMKSDASMGVEITFSQGDKSSGKRSESERDFLIETGQERSSSENLQRSAERPNSPAPTCLSMKSDASMDFLYQFSRGKNSSGKRF